jgi:hypothetical protein
MRLAFTQRGPNLELHLEEARSPALDAVASQGH